MHEDQLASETGQGEDLLSREFYASREPRQPLAAPVDVSRGLQRVSRRCKTCRPRSRTMLPA
jgi:hypothetical protein